ncbi:hypothetical protein [Paraburkholderia sp. CNPSo 3281]|uniref:hypothetical protein n=1 Tax=Paraburkholderia sp. CNPSo 3281 TaxID=2940933 RepID=UPI0035CD1BEA
MSSSTDVVCHVDADRASRLARRKVRAGYWKALRAFERRNSSLVGPFAALDQNGWRCKDTAQFPGNSCYVLWEKIRNRQIFYEGPETRESE